jgi:hypothetical protein
MYEYHPFTAVVNMSWAPAMGDSMLFVTAESDGACNVGPGYTGYGCFNYEDETQNLMLASIPFVVSLPKGATFLGATAELIIERQCAGETDTLCQHGPPLATFYGTEGAFAAADRGGNWHDFNTDNYRDITMINTSNQALVTATYAVSPDTGLFELVQNQ